MGGTRGSGIVSPITSNLTCAWDERSWWGMWYVFGSGEGGDDLGFTNLW